MKNKIKFLFMLALMAVMSVNAWAYDDWTGSNGSESWSVSINSGQYLCFDYERKGTSNSYFYVEFYWYEDGYKYVYPLHSQWSTEEKSGSVIYKYEGTASKITLRAYKSSGNTSDYLSVKNIRVLDTRPDTKISSITMEDFDLGVNTTKDIYPESVPFVSPVEFTWKSSDSNVASVNDCGVVSGLKSGKATITATAKDGSGLSASCVVNVKETEKLSLRNTWIGYNWWGSNHYESRQIDYSIEPNCASRKLIWTSSDESVAKVSDDGNITALKDGEVTITAKTTDGSNLSASCQVIARNDRESVWVNENNDFYSSLNYAYTDLNEPWQYLYVNQYGNAYYTVSNNSGNHYSGYGTQSEGSKISCNFTVDAYSEISIDGCLGGLSSFPYYYITIDGDVVYSSQDTEYRDYSSYDNGSYIDSYSVTKFLEPGTYNMEFVYDGCAHSDDKCFAMINYIGLSTFNDSTWNSTIANNSITMETLTVAREGILGGEALKVHEDLTKFKGLKVVGPMDSYDWKTIREMGVVCLDLTDATFSKYSDDNISTVKAVKLSKSVVDLTKNPFPSASYMFIPDEVKTISAKSFSVNFLDGCRGIEQISENAFKRSRIIGNMNFPSLQEIPAYAFDGCDRLLKLEFPVAQKVGKRAFAECKSLKTVSLPKTKDIGAYAFFNSALKEADFAEADTVYDHAFCMASVSKVNLPSVKYIGQGAFSRRFQVGSGWSSSIITNSTLINEIDIRSIEEICDSAFLYQHDIVSVQTPALIKVGKYAFCSDYNYNSNSKLQHIDLGNVVSIGSSAFYRCGKLETVDLKKVEKIGSEAFYYCSKIDNAILPNVSSVDYRAFYYCGNVKSIDVRRATFIGNEAFRECSNAVNAILSKADTISNNAFYGCKNLIEIDLPNVTKLGDNAFSGCSAAVDIKLSDKLTQLGDQSFYGCVAAETLTLPASITSLPSFCFSGSNNIKTINLNAPAPPAVGEIPFNMQTVYTATLRVPSASMGLYQSHDYWKHFYYYDVNPSVLKDLVLASHIDMKDLRMDKIRLTINVGASLSMSGSDAQDFRSVLFKADSKEAGVFLSNSERISSDETSVELAMGALTWRFFTLPFDVQIGDIENSNDAQVVYYCYDGEQRAKSGTGNSWKRVTTGVLSAGKGYIVQTSKATTLTLPATYETKDYAFLPYDVTTKLDENASAIAANKGWNYIGNPYTAYFNIANMDFDAPITVRTGNTYTAYSIKDDELALAPLQPFFVQATSANAKVKFNAVGRQTTAAIQHESNAKARGIAEQKIRKVVDLTLSNGDSSDRTRIVVNKSTATDDYDLNCDAAKMFSDEADALQLYSISDGVQYAINEGPQVSGEIALGFIVPKDGTYILRATRSDISVKLIDRTNNEVVELAGDGYAFEAEAGANETRFCIMINDAEDETPINAAEIAECGNAEYYDLTGRRVSKLAKGVNIVRKSGSVKKQINR